MTVSPTVISAHSTVIPAQAGIHNKTVILDVPGMTCQFCPITIRKALEKVPGVIEAKASFDSKTATITFDPDKTNVEALINATANAGYPSSLQP
ncbi:MAG: mercury resistance system periplasmic binding protein MerP [Gammaproteobacteria bacterium]|nr:mercury resistance system periplasmic binding protein MerP [Gammaproteobacteria bacterium]